MSDYNNRITRTTLKSLEEQEMQYTANLNPQQRFEYLQKLRDITHGTDNSEAEKIFHESRIKINRTDENS